MQYLPNGNITNKSDIGRYSYNSKKAFVLDSIAIDSSNYAAFDDMPYSIKYNAINKVQSIKQGNQEAKFTYLPSEERIQMTLTNQQGQDSMTKYYGINYEIEINHITNTHKEFAYINSPEGLIAVICKDSNTTNHSSLTTPHYIHTDYLGSIIAISDQQGNITNKYAYDAWGRPRNAETWSYKTAQLPIFQRGYTGHEHLAVFGLINMNYRLYDPVNARFISSDNLIPNITNTQSYNVYSYVLNNPLKYIDPDGHEPITIATILIGAAISGLFYTANVALFQPGGFDNWSWSEFGKSVAIGGVSGAVGGWAVGAAGFGTVGFVNGAMSGLIGGSVGGFVNGALTSWTSGGSLAEGFANGLKGGVIGGLSGFGIGGIFGGISAYRHGGDFWSGKGSKFIDAVRLPKADNLTKNGDEFASQQEILEYTKRNVGDPSKVNASIDIATNENLHEFNGSFKNGSLIHGGHPVGGVTVTTYGEASSQIYMDPSIKGALVNGVKDIVPKMLIAHEFLHAAHWSSGLSGYNIYSERATSSYSLAYAKHFDFGLERLSPYRIRMEGMNYPSSYSWRNFSHAINFGIR